MSWFKRTKPEDIAREMAVIDQEKKRATDGLKSINEERIKAANESENRQLNLDGLVTIGLYGSLSETVDTIKTQYDPLVRLVMVYIFLEQLSDECSSEEVSSLSNFSYKFFKQELSEQDWEANYFGDDGPGEGFFVVPVFWDGLSMIVEGTYEKLNDEEKNNICAMLCTELVSSIEDDDLIQRFITMARDKLTESGFITDSAEATFSSIEL